MNNVQIVKKRLKDLKQLSQNLKKSSEDDNDLNINIIKVIMNITKDVQNKSQLSQNNKNNNILHSAVQQHLKQSKISNKSNNNQSYQSNRNTRQSQEQDIKYKKSRNIKYQKKSYQQEQPIQEGIIQQNNELKQKNNVLEQKINKLEQRILELQKNIPQNDDNQSESSIQFKHMSYFRINENINIFLTKISINQKDYQKIQYYESQVKLTLDHLRIKNYNIKKSQNNGKKINKDKFIRLDLSDLIQIKYLPDYVLKLQFHDEDHQQYLYIRFDDYQSYHRWDIGLFINFKIIKSLGNNQLFKSNKVFVTHQLPNQPIQQNIKNNNIEQKSTLIRKISKQEKQLIKSSFKISDETDITQQEKIKLADYLLQKQKYLDLRKSIEQLSAKKKINIKNQENVVEQMLRKQTFSNQQKNQQKQIKQLSKTIQTNTKNQTASQSSKKSTNKQNSFNQSQLIKKMKQIQQERSKHQSNFEKIQQNSEQHDQNNSHYQHSEDREKEQQQDRLDQAKQILKMGMYVTKYAEGAFSPHQKRLFLSEDELQLRWQDKGDKKYKMILVDDIISVQIGKIGPGIQKHIGRGNIKNAKCFVLISLRAKDRKQLQFGMNSVSLMENFAEKLDIFVKSLKQKKEIKNIKF